MINLRIERPLHKKISLYRGHILQPKILKLYILYITITYPSPITLIKSHQQYWET
jgi:hypothetical protein